MFVFVLDRGMIWVLELKLNFSKLKCASKNFYSFHIVIFHNSIHNFEYTSPVQCTMESSNFKNFFALIRYITGWHRIMNASDKMLFIILNDLFFIFNSQQWAAFHPKNLLRNLSMTFVPSFVAVEIANKNYCHAVIDIETIYRSIKVKLRHWTCVSEIKRFSSIHRYLVVKNIKFILSLRIQNYVNNAKVCAIIFIFKI